MTSNNFMFVKFNTHITKTLEAWPRNFKIERVSGSHKKKIILPSCKVLNLPFATPNSNRVMEGKVLF